MSKCARVCVRVRVSACARVCVSACMREWLSECKCEAYYIARVRLRMCVRERVGVSESGV